MSANRPDPSDTWLQLSLASEALHESRTVISKVQVLECPERWSRLTSRTERQIKSARGSLQRLEQALTRLDEWLAEARHER